MSLKLLLLHRDYSSYKDLSDYIRIHLPFVDLVDAGFELFLQPERTKTVNL